MSAYKEETTNAGSIGDEELLISNCHYNDGQCSVSCKSSFLDEKKKKIVTSLHLLHFDVDEEEIWQKLLSINEKYKNEFETECNIFHDAVRFGLFDTNFTNVFKIYENNLNMNVIWQRFCECQNEAGVTLLHVACDVGNVEAVKLLLENGAHAILAQTFKTGNTPLHIAIVNKQQNIRILNFITSHLRLMNGPAFSDLIHVYNARGHTVLHSAVIHNRQELLKVLLMCCIQHDIDACDIKVLGSGDTILHLAVQRRQKSENNSDTSPEEDMILEYFLNAAEYKNYEGKNAYGVSLFDNHVDYEFIMRQLPQLNTEKRSDIDITDSDLDGSDGSDWDVGDTYDRIIHFSDNMFVSRFSKMANSNDSCKNNISSFSSSGSIMKFKIGYELLNRDYTKQLTVWLKVSTKEKNYFDNVQYVLWLEMISNNNISEGLQLSPRTIYEYGKNYNRHNNVEPIRAIMTECKDNDFKYDFDDDKDVDTQDDELISRRFAINFDQIIFRDVDQLNFVVNLEEKLRAYKTVIPQLGVNEFEQKMASDISSQFTISDLEFIMDEVYFAFEVFEIKSADLIRVGTLLSTNLATIKINEKVKSHESFLKFKVLKANNLVAPKPYKLSQTKVIDSLLVEPFPRNKFVSDSLVKLHKELKANRKENFENIWNKFCHSNANYKQVLRTISTLYHDAVKNGYFQLIESAVNEILNSDIVKEVWKRLCRWRNWHGETLLHIACECDKFETISSLLIYYPQASFDERFEDHQCPLNIAIRRHHPLEVIETIVINMLYVNDFELEILVAGTICRNDFPLAEILLKIRRKYNYLQHLTSKTYIIENHLPLAAMESLLYGPAYLNHIKLPEDLEGKETHDKAILKFRNVFTKEEFKKCLQLAIKRNYPSLAETLLSESSDFYINELHTILLKESEFYEVWSSTVRNKYVFLAELLLESHKRHSNITLDVTFADELSSTALRTYLQKAINDNCENLTEILLEICKKRNIELSVKLVCYLSSTIDCDSSVQQKIIPNEIVKIVQNYFPNALQLYENIDYNTNNKFILCIYKEISSINLSKQIKRIINVEIVKNNFDKTDSDVIMDMETNYITWCNQSMEKSKQLVRSNLDELKYKIEEIPEDEIAEIFNASQKHKSHTNFNNSLYHDAIIVDNWDFVIGCINAILTDDLKKYTKMRLGRWQNCRGETMLHVACEYGKLEAIKPLLGNFPGSMFMQTLAPRDTPLHLAIMNPHHRSALTKEFIDHISGMNKNDLLNLVNLYNRQGKTVLHLAIIYECLELMETILKCCAKHDIDACSVEVLGSGDTILHLAHQLKQTPAEKSDTSIMEKIILDNFPNAREYKNYDDKKVNEIKFHNNLHFSTNLLPKHTYKHSALYDNELENVVSLDNESNNVNNSKSIEIDIFLKQLELDLKNAMESDVEQIWSVFVCLNKFYQQKCNTENILYHDAVVVGYWQNLLECLQFIIFKVIRDDIIRRIFEWQNYHGDTISHIACKFASDFESVLKMWPKSCLVRSNVDLDTPLHILIRHNKATSMMSIPLKSEDWIHLLRLYNIEGYNVLEFAILKIHLHFVDIFLKMCFEFDIDVSTMKARTTNETIIGMIERLQFYGEEYINLIQMKNRIIENSPSKKHIIENIKSSLTELKSQIITNSKEVVGDFENDTDMFWSIFIQVNKFYQDTYKLKSSLYHDAVSFGLFDMLLCCLVNISPKYKISIEEGDDDDNQFKNKQLFNNVIDEFCAKDCWHESGEADYIGDILRRLCELCDNNGDLLLHVAIKSNKNFKEIFQMCPQAILVQSYINLSTPLHDAIICKSGFLEFLIREENCLYKEHFSLLMTKVNRKGLSVLDAALIKQCLTLAEFLIKYCIHNGIKLHTKLVTGPNHVIRVILEGRSKQVEEYLKKQKEPDNFEQMNKTKAIERREKIEKYFSILKNESLKCETFIESWNIYESINKSYQEECITDSVIYHDALLCYKSPNDFRQRISECINQSHFEEKIWQNLCQWRDSNNETLLHIESKRARADQNELFFFLFMKHREALFVQDKTTLATPFHIVLDVKRWLLTNVSGPPSKGYQFGFFNEFLNLLTKEEFSHAMRLYNREGWTVLHCAVLEYNLDLVKLLLRKCTQYDINPFTIKVQNSDDTIEQLSWCADAFYYKIYGSHPVNSNSMSVIVCSYQR